MSLLKNQQTEETQKEEVVVKEEPKETSKETFKEEKLPTETQAKIISKPTEETKSEVPKTEAKESEKDRIQEEFSRRFAALSKREKFISQKEKEGRGKIKRLEELEKLEASLKDNPYLEIEKHGGSYEEWTNKILKGDEYDQNKEIKEVKKELQSWKNEQAQLKIDSDDQRRLKTYNDGLMNINTYISDNSKRFPRTNFFGDEQLIFDIIATRYQQDVERYGKEYAKENLLSIEKSSEMAEDWRVEYVKSKKTEGLEHFQKTFGEFTTRESSEEKKALAAEEEKLTDKTLEPRGALPERTRRLLGLRTLTNKQQTTVPAKEAKQGFKNDKERLVHAASLLKWS